MTLYVEYPASLPVPQTSSIGPAERRLLSQESRPRDAAALSRDRLELERITWPPLSAAQVEELRAWWESTLAYGGRYFRATWPVPRGLTSCVRRLLEAPRWQFVPGGFWAISALCQVRGRGMDPTRPPLTRFLAHFDGDTYEEVTEASLSGIPSSYAASAAGFGQEAVFSSAPVLSQLRPGENFLNHEQWQFDVWLTLDDPLARQFKTVLEVASFNGTTKRIMLLIGVESGSSEVRASVWNSIAPGGGGEQSCNEISLDSRAISATDRTHVRVVRDGASVTQWHDGVLVAEFDDPYSFSSADTFADERLFIGAQAGNLLTPGGSVSGFVAPYYGRIDEMRFAIERTDDGAFDPPTRPFILPS